MELIRIEKLMGEQGLASRRESKKILLEGKVFIKGKKVKAGQKVNPSAEITINNEGKEDLEEKRTVAVFKPRGFLSSKDKEKKNIFDIFPELSDLNCVGRLDKDTEGLILLSNDGKITKLVTGKVVMPDGTKRSLVDKEYIVTVRENIFPWMVEKMKTGITLRDGPALVEEGRKISRHVFSVTLREGKKHEVRRIANHFRLTVTNLRRVRIGEIKLGRMKPKQWRRLKKEEVTYIDSLLP